MTISAEAAQQPSASERIRQRERWPRRENCMIVFQEALGRHAVMRYREFHRIRLQVSRERQRLRDEVLRMGVPCTVGVMSEANCWMGVSSIFIPDSQAALSSSSSGAPPPPPESGAPSESEWF